MTEIENRFWAKVHKTDNCWLWTGSTNRQGYGTFWLFGKKLAHRIAWELNNDRFVPERMKVCHSCDNPKCVNPQHLWIGTQKDNVQDCIQKSRYAAFAPLSSCSRGHEFPKNRRRYKSGGTYCVICDKLRGRKA